MALIFALSAEPSPGPDLGGMQEVASYLAHFGIYGALWTAFAWALGWRRPWLAWVLAVAYGASDELHQSTVAGRDASVADLAVDALGAAAAWALASAVRRSGRPGRALRRPHAAAPTQPQSR
jgi:VanZ family protein